METLKPDMLATLMEICGHDAMFVVRAFLHSGMDLQRTQDFVIDTLDVS